MNSINIINLILTIIIAILGGYLADKKKVPAAYMLGALFLVAIGLNTNIKKLIFSGAKPLTLGFCCWFAISLVSIGLQKILGIF